MRGTALRGISRAWRTILQIWVFLLAASAVHAATHTISSLPYTASQTGVNYSETLYVAGTHLSSATNGIRITGHDIVLMLGGDTISFGTGNGNGHYGIQTWGDGANGSYNIKIVGGTILHHPSDTTVEWNRCLQFAGAKNYLIENTDLIVKGFNGSCIGVLSGSYRNCNVEFSGGRWTSEVTAYDSRCNYDGICASFGVLASSGYDYHWKIHDVVITQTPGQGISLGGLSYIYDCSITVDARNDFYTYYSGNVCASAANSFAVIASELLAGSELYNNVILAGENYQGCDGGFLLQVSKGTPFNHIKVHDNYISIHRGEDAHYGPMNPKGIKSRYHNRHVDIYNNEIYIYVGDTTRSAYGPNGIGIETITRFDSGSDWVDGRVPDSFIVIENNYVEMIALNSEIDEVQCTRIVAPEDPSVYLWDQAGMVWRNNHLVTPLWAHHFGGYDGDAQNVTVIGDTIEFSNSPWGSSNKCSFFLGYAYDGRGNKALDCFFMNGAMDTSIGFMHSSGEHSIALQRTLPVRVMGNNGCPVSNAQVTVVNNYGRTILSQTTNSSGRVSGAVTYWYEAEDGSDSTNYNNFQITASLGGDSKIQNVTVNSQTLEQTLTLDNTAGNCGGADVTPPGAITNLAVTPTGTSSLELTWTAPGDDGYSGTADHYVIKYSTGNITEGTFHLATTAASPPAPLSAGTGQSYTLNGLFADQTYYVAIKTYDEENNASNISNVPSATTESGGVTIPVPTPTGTAIDTINASVTVTCNQVSSSVPVFYQFALDDGPAFPSPTFQTGQTGGGTAWSIYTGLQEQPYYWRCRAIATNLADTSGWSNTQSFTYSSGGGGSNNPPTAPTPVSPAEGDTVTSNPITLSVANATDPDGDPLRYNFQISTDSGFNNISASLFDIAEDPGQTSALFSSFNPTPGQRYWWRSYVFDGQVNSDYSTYVSFVYYSIVTGHECETPPGYPDLIAPAMGADAGSQTPTLCIGNSQPAPGCPDPQSYKFEVFSDPSLNNLVDSGTVNETTDSTCFSVTPLLDPGRYYWWRAQCSNGTAVSTWAGTFYFHTPNNPPESPTLVSPGDDDSVTTARPDLSANSVSDPDGTPPAYLFEVSSDESFSTLASSGQVLGESGVVTWTVADPLTNNTRFYWRVRATDGIDYSAYSSTRSFTVAVAGNTPPSVPTVQSPPDGATVDTVHPTLIVLNAFDDEGDPLTYDFELYNQAADTLIGGAYGINEDVTATGWTLLMALQDSTTYRWRARCHDGHAYSLWTILSQFTVIVGADVNEPPSLPVHVSPGNGSTIITAPIVLLIQNSIDPESDPISYDFWIYSDSLLNEVVETKFDVEQQAGGQTFITFDFLPTSGHNYWWRVRAKDGQNTTDFSEATWFLYWNLSTGQDEYTAGAAEPISGSTVLTTQPLLKAANIAVTGQNYYYFEVAADSTFFNIECTSPPILEQTGNYTTWQVEDPLRSGQEYYWRVHANDYAYSPASKFFVDEAVFASPNPVHLGELVTFHLPDQPSDLLIQTVSGETVLIQESIASLWEWDLRNASGHQVSVGVYLWYITGTSANGKILVKP